MKRILSLFLLIAVCLSASPAIAEETTPCDFVAQQGFTIAETFESPGHRTCYLIETSDSQGLTFSDETNAYCIVGTPLLDQDYDIAKIRDLFIDLIRRYEWDVSYYWPDYANEEKITASYGITRDLNRTKRNYDDKGAYVMDLILTFAVEYPSLSGNSTASISSDSFTASEVVSFLQERGMHVTSEGPREDKPFCFLGEYDSTANKFQYCDYEIRFCVGGESYLAQGRLLVRSERNAIRSTFLEMVSAFDWYRATVAPLNADRWVHYNDNGQVDKRDVYYYDKDQFISVLTEYFSL